jgi:UDPglucose 6-dehydrogenase
MKICVVGSGYVGLVAGVCFAETGHTVVCVDNDEAKVEKMTEGEVPIFEPGLKDLMHRNLEESRLRFTSDLAEAVKESLVVFITVGTPQGDDGRADLKFVLGVAAEVADAMDSYKIVVVKSTVPVGTCEKVRDTIKARTSQEFDVASNPEFLKEGAAIEDFLKPDRVVVGCGDVRVAEIMKELYSPFLRTDNPIIIMDLRSAEMTKYASNSLLATRITFMNQIANICDRLGVNVDHVRRGMGADRRIGHRFLFPGVGYGGSCFPKDIRALIRTSDEADYDFSILRAVDEVNDAQKKVLVDKLRIYYKGDLSGKKVAVWGLAFKPRTDDVREAPALHVIRELLAEGVKVSAFDPEAVDTARDEIGDEIEYAPSSYDALKDADALLIVTEWNEFRRPDLARMKKLMKKPVIFDGRNIYTRKVVEKAGFDYFGIGV